MDSESENEDEQDAHAEEPLLAAERQRYVYAGIEDYISSNKGTPLCGPCRAPPSSPTPPPLRITTVDSEPQELDGKRKSDAQLKAHAFAVPLMELCKMVCGKECTYGQQCQRSTPVGIICDMRIAFWGDENMCAPTSTERRNKILSILANAHSVNEKKLVFAVSDKLSSNGLRSVCELSYLHMLGLTTKAQKSQAPSQWMRCKDTILTGKISEVTYNRGQPKYVHALAYIDYIVDKICDTTPYGGKSALCI